MLQEDKALTGRFNLQFPNLTVRVLKGDNKNWTYKILYDAYASPGQVKKIDNFAKKLMIVNYQLERIPF